MSHDDFNWMVSQAVAGVRPGATTPSISAEALGHMQNQASTLLGQWRAMPSGQSLELEVSLG